MPSPLVSMIMVTSWDGVIGNKGKLPWHLPRDLDNFRRLTMGHAVIMGRKTFESIESPLEGRRKIVLSRNPDYRPEDAWVAASLKEAIDQAGAGNPRGHIFVIGGGQVFKEAMPLVQRVYLTIVNGDFEGDVQFPIQTLFQAGWRHSAFEVFGADAENRHHMMFRHIDRVTT